jgi:response regulator RpfG family c-di-GMP phosphodiesterase
MQEERPPFYFLNKLINVLVVDDDNGVVSLIRDVIAPISIFSLQTASSARDAEPLIASPDRIHLCILDLGLTDRENDEFYLLKKYAARCSFIIFTGSTSPHKGFIAHQLGAKAIIEKAPGFNNLEFLKQINYYALLNIINPRYGSANDTLSHSTDILFQYSPKFVSQWAIQMGISDRELRHIWTRNLGANAKIILSIYQIFEAAFHFHERRLVRANAYQNQPVNDQNGYRRLEEYFACHRSTIADFIAFGNIVAAMKG